LAYIFTLPHTAQGNPGDIKPECSLVLLQWSLQLTISQHVKTSWSGYE